MTPPNITPFNIGSLRFDFSDTYRLPSDHPQAGKFSDGPIFCYHINLPDRSVLVDAPAYEPEYLDELLIPDFIPPPSLLEQFAERDINPATITDIIITHAHFDHFNGTTRLVDGRYIPTFPNARHYLGAGDWQPDSFGELEARTLVVLHEAGLLHLVNQPTPIGDGLIILPMPGETPGHQILAFDTADRRTYITGDLYHNEIEFDYPALNVYWADEVTMPASKRAFLEQAATLNHHIYFAHIPGPYQMIQVEKDYQWEKVNY